MSVGLIHQLTTSIHACRQFRYRYERTAGVTDIGRDIKTFDKVTLRGSMRK